MINKSPELFDEVVSILSSFLKTDKKEIQLKTRLVEDLGFDSIDFIEVFTRMNELQNLKGYEHEIGNLRTVADVLILLEKAKNNNA